MSTSPHQIGGWFRSLVGAHAENAPDAGAYAILRLRELGIRVEYSAEAWPELSAAVLRAEGLKPLSVAAEIADVSRGTAWRWAQTGRLATIRRGRLLWTSMPAIRRAMSGFVAPGATKSARSEGFDFQRPTAGTKMSRESAVRQGAAIGAAPGETEPA